MTLSDLSVREFLQKLGGGEATPGGGCAAALAGASAAELLAMVARFTVGRNKFREAWETMSRVRDEADRLAGLFTDLVEADAAAYTRVLEAYQLPKETGAEKQSRNTAIEKAMAGAAAAPLQTLRTVSELLDLAAPALEKGNPNCVTDTAVAVQLARAAGLGAAYNVRINLASLPDGPKKEDLARETEELTERVLSLVRSLEPVVETALGR